MAIFIPDTDGGYYVEQGIVFHDVRGRTMTVALFDDDSQAEEYLRKMVNGHAAPKKKKTVKTSGKYEQKKRKHHK